MKIGIIGGSGLDDPQIIQNPVEKAVTTRFGLPSSTLTCGTINGISVVILARHGKRHTIMPTNVNNRANIWALKEEGCTHVLVSTACGSLREEIKPGQFVLIDQFIDRTTKRHQTFYNDLLHAPETICHIPMAEPFCPKLRKVILESAQNLNIPIHSKGTMITIEGPRFSTKAESYMFKQWGADVINMSTAPEAVLAREAGMCYAAVAMATDYDCWREGESVTWEQVLKTFQQNAENVKKLILKTISSINHSECSCMSSHNTSLLGGTVIDSIKSKIRTIPNWPKQGIMFRDITTLMNDAQGLQDVIRLFVERYKDKDIDKIVGIESRGIIIGGALAHQLKVPFVPIRKKGKLPSKTIQQEYELEYGTDIMEIHNDALSSGEKVVVIDDLIATGGTSLAAVQLVRKLNAELIECAFIIDLPDIGGTKKLKEANIPFYVMVEFEGE